MFVDDFADAIIYFLKKKIKEPYINIGSGKDYSIKWYTEFLCKIILGKKIKIIFDKSKPNGTLKKLLDISIAKKYGWEAKTSLKEGVKQTLHDFHSIN